MFLVFPLSSNHSSRFILATNRFIAPDLRTISRAFQVHGQFLEAFPISSGHINDSFAAVYDQAGTTARYILQRINHEVFRDPSAVMENIGRVTRHTADKLIDDGFNDVTRRVLTIIPTRDGEVLYVDREGNSWRCYFYIEKARTHNVAGSATLAYEAAKAFGTFGRHLQDLDGASLHETIPRFHHTRSRFDTFMQAVNEDPMNRAADVKDEIAFFEKHEPDVDVVLDRLASGEIPLRVAHNDTKINNVMIDEITSEGICVIDLDTVMPGTPLYDFGDLVRTSTSPAAEDERDLSKVMMQMPMFQALVLGYLKGSGDLLTKPELDLLAFSGRLIGLEIGLRFLTDHLLGDKYFKIHRPGHNLDRCRTQIRLVESIEWQEDEMRALVDGIAQGEVGR